MELDAQRDTPAAAPALWSARAPGEYAGPRPADSPYTEPRGFPTTRGFARRHLVMVTVPGLDTAVELDVVMADAAGWARTAESRESGWSVVKSDGSLDGAAGPAMVLAVRAPGP